MVGSGAVASYLFQSHENLKSQIVVCIWETHLKEIFVLSILIHQQIS